MSEWPKYILLNGADYFQYFLDNKLRLDGGSGNVSHMVLQLDRDANCDSIKRYITEHAVARYISSLRLNLGLWFQKPRWVRTESGIVSCEIYDRNAFSLEEWVQDIQIDCKKESPIRFHIILSPNYSLLVFSWHHILMDARGAELFLLELGNQSLDKLKFTDTLLDEPWTYRMECIRYVKDYMKPKVLQGYQHVTMQESDMSIVQISLTMEQTRSMDQMIAHNGMTLTRSLFYIAWCSMMLEIDNRQPSYHWVAVPQDRRKKGGDGFGLQNQVSFMYFQIDLSHSFIERIHSLKEQMMDQMRQNLPKRNQIMLDSMVRFPMWLYRLLVSRPSRGRMASFYFSDIGEGLDKIKSFMGMPIHEIYHLPPCSLNPAFTFVFDRRDERLRMTLICPKKLAMHLSTDKWMAELNNWAHESTSND